MAPGCDRRLLPSCLDSSRHGNPLGGAGRQLRPAPLAPIALTLAHRAHPLATSPALRVVGFPHILDKIADEHLLDVQASRLISDGPVQRDLVSGDERPRCVSQCTGRVVECSVYLCTIRYPDDDVF